jgi:uncharacterized protein YdaU (DUF1376 family)
MAGAHDNNWMPLYIGDYLRDTTRLTVAEHGAYLLLIMDYWVNGPPPDDDRELARIARTPLPVWRRYYRGQLSKMFTCQGGRWLHKRVDRELERARELNEKKREGGRASAAVRRARKGTAQPEHRSEHRSEDSSQCVRECVRLPIHSKEEGLDPYESNPASLTAARDASPPLPSQGDGVAALRASTKVEPLDEAERAERLAMLDRCKAILRGKSVVFDSESGAPMPPDPRILEFRARLLRLNTLAGERLAGEVRLAAWDAIGRADAIGDPDALPPELAADLAAIACLDAAA